MEQKNKGRGNKDFKKRGQIVSSDGCLKKGGWDLLRAQSSEPILQSSEPILQNLKILIFTEKVLHNKI